MAEGSDGKTTNNMWSLLPSFDPAVDVVREYIEKVHRRHLPQVVLGPKLGLQGNRMGAGRQFQQRL